MKTFVRLVFGMVCLHLCTVPQLLAGPPKYQIFDLGTLGGSLSAGYAINDAGQITGYSNLAGDNAHHAFLYNGMMSDLGTLGGTSSEGDAINAAGQVVGQSDTLGDSATHAFLFSGGSMSDLGTLGGHQSYGNSINDAGQITGYSFLSINPGQRRAFLYVSGSMFDLNTLAAENMGGFDVLNYGGGINNNGWITGYGVVHASGQIHAFLAKPLDAALDIRLAAGKAIISWNATAAGFVLESTPLLGPLANWNSVTNSPGVVNGQYQITNDITGFAKFYRLKSGSD